MICQYIDGQYGIKIKMWKCRRKGILKIKAFYDYMES